MEAYIHLHNTAEDCDKADSVCYTKMILSTKPDIGEVLQISFPSSFTDNKHAKWLKKIPTYPWVVGYIKDEIFNQRAAYLIGVYYGGIEKIDLRKIQNTK